MSDAVATINLAPPIVLCGYTTDGRMVLGGAFQAADTMGVPLWYLMDLADENRCVISIPHFFASAMEHGWDDRQTFAKLAENMAERGCAVDMDDLRSKCNAMLMAVVERHPELTTNERETVVMQAGRLMRIELETDWQKMPAGWS